MVIDRPAHPVFVALLFLMLCTVLYFPGNGSVSLTDPDDVFYAETAKEMLQHQSILTPIIFDQPQFEKPPLYYWLLMLAFRTFGVSTWAARLASALLATFSVLATWYFIRRLVDEITARYAAVILATTIWWIGLARVVLTDLLFSMLIMLSMYAVLVWFLERRPRWLYLFGVCTALATLAKSPLGLILPMAAVAGLLAFHREGKLAKQFFFGRWWLVFLVISLPWFLWASYEYGGTFLREYFVHDHWDRFFRAEHGSFDKWYFYPFALSVFFLPWTPYLFLAPRRSLQQRGVVSFLVLWVVVMILLLSLAHSKLATYISPVYPALAILCALGIRQATAARWQRGVTVGLLVIVSFALVAGALVVGARYEEFATAAIVTFGLLSLSLLVAAGLVIARRTSHAMMISASGVVIFVLTSAIMTFHLLESGTTQGRLPAIVERYHFEGRPILCSYLYARGIAFYTGNPVIVLARSQHPFWSDHPVPVLSADDQITAFLSRQDSLLCVLSPREMERLRALASPLGNIDTLEWAMDKTIAIYHSRVAAVATVSK